MINLKFCLINTENLFLVFNQELPAHFIHMDRNQWQSLSSPSYNIKPLHKTLEMAKSLLDIDADIIMMTEIGGIESLKNFNQHFLKGLYSPILIEGNSDRHIDVGFLIKKDLPFYYDLFSHKNHEIDLQIAKEPGQTYRFSRDCAELRLFANNVDNPFLVILLTHLKSPLDPENIDFGGVKRRTSEMKACVDIYNNIKTQFPDVPVILAGDFNGHAGRLQTDPEFEVIYKKTDLVDIFERAGTPISDRVSYIQIKSGLRADPKQIDYVFLSESLAPHLNIKSVATYYYKDEFGFNIKKPATMEEKSALPSDHYPLTFILENLKK